MNHYIKWNKECDFKPVSIQLRFYFFFSTAIVLEAMAECRIRDFDHIHIMSGLFNSLNTAEDSTTAQAVIHRLSRL
jgi:hypothetical protein